MNEPACNDNTKYMAIFSGHYHISTTVKTRKQWFNMYCIDVKEKPVDFKLDKGVNKQ